MNEEKTETAEPTVTVRRLPLYKGVVDDMVNDGIQFGRDYPVAYFESRFNSKLGSPEFTFEMLELRGYLETEHGYYLRQSENGKVWSIPPAPNHEDVAAGFDSKVRKFAVRSINMRSATLLNPKAELTDSQRAKMEKNLEHASIRLVLISRAKSISDVVMKHSPKLLKK